MFWKCCVYLKPRFYSDHGISQKKEKLRLKVMFQTLHSSLKWIKGRKATGATGATKDCSVRSLLQCLFGLRSKKHLQSWKLWVIMDLGHNFSFYPLFWCIEGFEEVKAESWSIRLFHLFSSWTGKWKGEHREGEQDAVSPFPPTRELSVGLELREIL